MDYSPPGSSVHGILQARYWSGWLLFILLLWILENSLLRVIFATQGSNPGFPQILYHLNYPESPVYISKIKYIVTSSYKFKFTKILLSLIDPTSLFLFSWIDCLVSKWHQCTYALFHNALRSLRITKQFGMTAYLPFFCPQDTSFQKVELQCVKKKITCNTSLCGFGLYPMCVCVCVCIYICSFSLFRFTLNTSFFFFFGFFILTFYYEHH